MASLSDRALPEPHDQPLDPQGLARTYADLGRQVLARGAGDDALATICRLAILTVPGCESASITAWRENKPRTLAATDATARLADQIQYDLRSGPCLDAAQPEPDGPDTPGPGPDRGPDPAQLAGDLAADPRWPVFGPRAATEAGVRSVLAVRLVIDLDRDPGAALNLYSHDLDAFTDESVLLAGLLAAHSALAVTALLARGHAEHLARALDSNRLIGVAIGVLITRHKITVEQGFDLLRIASQTRNRKLADIAQDVIDTGTLDLGRRS